MNEIQTTQIPFRRAYVGIDNGYTGAIACLLPDNRVLARPVLCQEDGKNRWLDVYGNRALLGELLTNAGVTPDEVVVGCERCHAVPGFGPHNNYVNGMTAEFWRVVLTLEKITFLWVNPGTWQRRILGNTRNRDTKKLAALMRQQLFPRFDITGFNREQREGISDAILIAQWVREMNK